MEKNCLYCSAHFTTNRKNKKYCSDNCKQMAYFKRNGLVLSGKSETGNVKYNAPALVLEQNANTMIRPIVKSEDKKDETVKYVLDEPKVKYEKKSETPAVKFVSENIPDLEVLQATLDRFMASMERKFDQAFENIKQELAVKYESLIAKPDLTENSAFLNEPKINYCNPCENIKYAFDVKEKNVQMEETKEDEDHHQVKFMELYSNDDNINEDELLELEQNERLAGNDEQEEDENEELEAEEEYEEESEENIELSADALYIKELEKQLVELKEALLSRAQPIEEEEPEQEYKRIESSLVKQIEKNYEKNNTESPFKNPIKYWNIDEIMNMNWINVRLRSIIESMIKLSNYSHIDKNTLLCLIDAINRLVKSNTFKSLPENYPHRELIKELYIKLNSLTRNTFTERPKFVLSVELKSRLIAIRHQMIQYTPAMKFSEMDFTEKNYLHPLKNDDPLPRKKKDWEYRYEEMKREKLRNAA